ncbi:hypothetical protein AALB39_22065 [Lachnospiraceae bacterium 54-53]
MKKRRFLSLCMAGVLSVSAVLPAYAEVGPGKTEDPIPDGVTQEKWVRLNDQSIEFNELEDLVRYYNPDMQNTVDTIQNSIGNMKYIQDEMTGYIRDLESEAEDLKVRGGTDSIDGMKQYIILNATIKGIKSSSESLRRTLNYMNRANSSVNSNIIFAGNNYTYYASQIMTGYSPDSSPVIGPVPELDPAVLSNMDLEADTAKALGNNYELISERRTSSDKTTTGMKNKEARVLEGEQRVAVTMESYYQAVLQAGSTYEAACTAYERAELEKVKADRSIQLGMLGKISYLQAQMSYLQAGSEKQSAYNTLYQAYDTYQWAIKEIIMTQTQ